MKVELRNATTMVITPESVAEQLALERFASGHATLERPLPFTSNVALLLVEAKP